MRRCLACLAAVLLACSGSVAPRSTTSATGPSASPAVTGSGSVAVTPAAGSPGTFASGPRIGSLAVVPDGGGLLLGGPDGQLTALKVASGDGSLSLAGVFPAHVAEAAALVASPSGQLVFAGSQGTVATHARADDGTLTFLSTVTLGQGLFPVQDAVYMPGIDGKDDHLVVNGYGQAGPELVNWVASASVGTGGLTPVATVPVDPVAFPTSGSASMLEQVVASAGRRVFALNPASIAVLDVAGDGSLAPVPGSPFSIPAPALGSFAIAADPGGEAIFLADDAGEISRYAVATDGALTRGAVFQAGAKVWGLAVHPGGGWVVATVRPDQVIVLDAGALTPVATSPVTLPGAAGAIAGCAFASDGRRLYVGYASDQDTIVAVLDVHVPQPPTVTCVGTTEAPVRLETSPGACSVTVDAANGLAGTCADAGGGLASCTFGGAGSLPLAPGTHAVEVVGTAEDGSSASCTSHLTVVDVEPPAISIAPPATLWPPNHKLVDVNLGLRTDDNCSPPPPTITCSAVSSEPEDGPGENHEPDVVWSGGHLWLRAERDGNGPGRVYAVTCTATDAAGLKAIAHATVRVPHDQGH
ncbi:MAG TPA: hypothetical protein VFP65_18245 [Anaeromyxobacteraceae bacterium]|nr:hypothetical protein [Anaeromyxobacteraceae bacterium]